MTGEAGRSRAHVWAWTVGVLLVVSLIGTAAVVTRDDNRPGTGPGPGVGGPALSVGWIGGTGSVSANGVARGSIRVSGAVHPDTDLDVSLSSATFVAIPDGCLVSITKVRHSWITADGRTLHCTLRGSNADRRSSVSFVAVADDRSDGFVTGTASIGDSSMRLADRPVTVGVKPETPEFRLLSAPDFLNSDIADLTRGGANFDPTTEGNGTNAYYEKALNTVFDDWASKKPDDITVAGDLVDGHWAQDTDGLKMFGPVATPAQKRAAILRAGAVYYSQWAERFRAHGLDNVHPAMGDHEYGDNNWPRWKLELASTFQHAWAEQFTTKADGQPKFADRPIGSIHESSAYAWRPRPDVQLITLDEFDPTPSGMKLRIDQQQQAWLIQVLKQAKADSVRWILVQGHLPILGPVREGASSGLSYEGGHKSALWRIFKKYGVDVYLCGEVHDVTAIHRDGVLQLSHGGIFQFGRLNYLIADFYPNHLDLKIYDYDFDVVGTDRLWETRDHIPADVVYKPDPGIIATGQLWRDGRLTRLSGAMAPYTP
jgi:hypothetical protein